MLSSSQDQEHQFCCNFNSTSRQFWGKLLTYFPIFHLAAFLYSKALPIITQFVFQKFSWLYQFCNNFYKLEKKSQFKNFKWYFSIINNYFEFRNFLKKITFFISYNFCFATTNDNETTNKQDNEIFDPLSGLQ